MLHVASRVARDTRAPFRQTLSDWGGFVGHVAIAALIVVRAPAISLFLLPSIVHMLLAAWSFLIRDRPRAQLQDPVGRALAYVTAYGMLLFVQIAAAFRPEWLVPTTDTRLLAVGAVCGLAGVLLEIWAIWHLRRAFATEPAARRLVRTGPYRLSRHPIYTGGCLAMLGLLLTRPTITLGLALAAWLICTRLRIKYEEAILLDAFPEYADYQCHVGVVIPRRTASDANVSGLSSISPLL
jgi:protein-S-isoprenylcysteine O-methyltransferase Ste14